MTAMFQGILRDDAWFNGNITVEAQNGEVINDAIFIRNAKVCDRFIQITETVHTDTSLRARPFSQMKMRMTDKRKVYGRAVHGGRGHNYTVEDLPM